MGHTQSISVTNTNIGIEKGSGSVSISTPAANRGGCDAIAVRSSSVSGSTSALDLMKMKLQDSGIPDSSPGSALSGSGTLEVNGTKPMETSKVLQNDNKKDSSGDGDMSDSSSDSGDEDGGPTKDGCIFQCKSDKATVQPTPISWEKLSGTDWTLVTTNDGKRCYYNSVTQVSSWQMGSELIEFGKKHDSGTLEAQSISVTNTNIAIEKGSGSVGISTPAANRGGCDAIAVRSSSVSGSTSALDLIKMKLQDSGISDSSPGPALSGSGTLEVNGTKPMETSTVIQKDNSGDGDMSDSSSGSEDEDGGPTKDGCILQCKHVFNIGPTFMLLSSLCSSISLEGRGSTQSSRQPARNSHAHHSNILRNISSIWNIRSVEGRQDGNMMMHMTGFCIDQRGILLTCAHGIINGWELTAYIDDNKYYDAKVVKKSNDWDMALLKVGAKDEQFDFVFLVDENYEIRCGQEVHVLGHPGFLAGSFYSGMVGYPFRGYDPTLLDEEQYDDKKDEDLVRCRFQKVEDHRRIGNTVPILGATLLNRNENVPLIQINNIPCIEGASGSPIFTNSGLVIGMYQSGLGNVQRAIHFSALRRLIEIANSEIE